MHEQSNNLKINPVAPVKLFVCNKTPAFTTFNSSSQSYIFFNSHVRNTLSICHKDLFSFLFEGTVFSCAGRVFFFSDNLSFSFHGVHIQFEESLFAVGCPLRNSEA